MNTHQILSRDDGMAYAVVEKIGKNAWSWAVFDHPYRRGEEPQPGSTVGGVAASQSGAIYWCIRAATREGFFEGQKQAATKYGDPANEQVVRIVRPVRSNLAFG